MGKKKRPEDEVSVASDRSGILKKGGILERRNYDKSKIKLTSSLQVNTPCNAVMAAASGKQSSSTEPRIRRVSMTDAVPTDAGPTTSSTPFLTQPSNPVSTRNEYDILGHQEENSESVEMDSSQLNNTTEKASVRCPPITVRRMSVKEINEMLRRMDGDGKFVLRNLNGSVQIRSKCKTLFDKTVNALKILNSEFYTHANREETLVKIVVSGLPVFEKDELLVELKKNNITPRELKMLSKTKDNDSALYVLYFDKGTVKLNKLREVKYLFNVVVWWRHWTRKNSDVVQCFRCQRFGHGSRHCNMKARCVKCGEEHMSSECTIPKAQNDPRYTHDVIKCANCGNNHTASFKECRIRLDFIKRQERNSHQVTGNKGTARAPRTFNSTRVDHNVSFAAALSGTAPTYPTSSRSDAAEGTSNNIFTISEFLGLARDMYNRLGGCTSREDQFFALHELMVKYLYVR